MKSIELSKLHWKAIRISRAHQCEALQPSSDADYMKRLGHHLIDNNLAYDPLDSVLLGFSTRYGDLKINGKDPTFRELNPLFDRIFEPSEHVEIEGIRWVKIKGRRNVTSTHYVCIPPQETKRDVEPAKQEISQ